MRIERVWAMPHKYTFRIPPIAALLAEEMMATGSVWADPFCGLHSPATITNDADEMVPATMHLDGLTFLQTIDTVDGVLFDPPYSTEQALRKYKTKYGGTAGRAEYWAKCMNETARAVRPGGKVICFGWNSNGVGAKRGFVLERVLLVAHGACHPMDTIVTVEIKK